MLELLLLLLKRVARHHGTTRLGQLYHGRGRRSDSHRLWRLHQLLLLPKITLILLHHLMLVLIAWHHLLLVLIAWHHLLLLLSMHHGLLLLPWQQGLLAYGEWLQGLLTTHV